MGDLLVSLLLPALAVAVNPIPIIAAVTLLMTGHGRRNTPAFLASLIVVMAADGLLKLFLLGQVSSTTSSQVHGGVQLALGLVFVGIFLVQWRSKPVPLGEEPGWMKMMNKAGFGAAVVLGLALTNYALLSAGASTIRQAGLSTAAELAALAFFIVVPVSTLAAALILFLVTPLGRTAAGPSEDLAHEALPGDPPRGARPHGGTLQRTGVGGAPALTTRLPGGHRG